MKVICVAQTINQFNTRQNIGIEVSFVLQDIPVANVKLSEGNGKFK